MQLAIETSSLVSSVALLHEGTLRSEITIQAKLTHSEQLMPHIADMLAKAGVTKKQIDSISVSLGPGSFTGLRIGLATAKGLAFAWEVPLVGIETPVSLAWNFIGHAAYICPLIDAQKGNVYAALYRWEKGQLQVYNDIFIAPFTAVLDTLARQEKRVVFCGDAAIKGRDKIEKEAAFSLAPATMVIPWAGSLALAADERIRIGDYDDVMHLTPSYKRRSEAEILWEKRQGEKKYDRT